MTFWKDTWWTLGLRARFFDRMRQRAMLQPRYMSCTTLSKITEPTFCRATHDNRFDWRWIDAVVSDGYLAETNTALSTIHASRVEWLGDLPHYYTPDEMAEIKRRLDAGETVSYAAAEYGSIHFGSFSISLLERIWAIFCGLEPPREGAKTEAMTTKRILLVSMIMQKNPFRKLVYWLALAKAGYPVSLAQLWRPLGILSLRGRHLAYCKGGKNEYFFLGNEPTKAPRPDFQPLEKVDRRFSLAKPAYDHM